MANAQQAFVANRLDARGSCSVEHVLRFELVTVATDELHKGQSIFLALGENGVVHTVRVDELEGNRPKAAFNSVSCVIVHMTCSQQ